MSPQHQDSEIKSKIAEILQSLPNSPGVYRMLNATGKVIYVGKASNLKKRVSSYFQKTTQDIKTHAMLKHIVDIETIVTHTEGEALLLENNLIKEYRPRYNILYRDDKSYPYIYLTTEHSFPRLTFHRGALKGKGKYFGPYPSAGAVRDTLAMMQKTFSVRQCSDTFYKNRSRPCLQYQIKRCTAPCVGFIDKQEYAHEVEQAIMFLQGKSTKLISKIAKEMEQAAKQLDFEHAARLRDRIANLRRIQEKQYISDSAGDFDVIAAASEASESCVQVFRIRNGHNLGNKAYFPNKTSQQDNASLINAFIAQHYLGSSTTKKLDLPASIIVAEPIEDHELLEQLLLEQNHSKITIQANVRGHKAKWLKMARQNASHAIKSRLATQASVLARFTALQKMFHLADLPNRLECFDISHSMGEATVASCVVFDQSGPLKSDYRRFNIKDITEGDDYAAMQQALLRRYRRLTEENKKLPDIIFVDGGKGQLGKAKLVLDELQLADILLVGVAKGPTRKPGMEQILIAVADSELIKPVNVPNDSPALHLIQQIRDEAHRFAITGHRSQRNKARTRSVLEDIEGLGPKRRQTLLSQFGGIKEVQKAGIEDLASVPGISQQLAKKIYETFHQDS